MKNYRPAPKLTRADIVRAFTSPQLTRKETMSLVNRYMGNSPVPPTWSYEGVRGMLGKLAARLWARRLRHRRTGSYRNEAGRWVHPTVQTIYDFGITPELLNAFNNLSTSRNAKPLCYDEFHRTTLGRKKSAIYQKDANGKNT